MDERQIVAFRLGEEEYAVSIQDVREIIRPTTVTRVPRTAEFIKGVINLRGVVVPVINLHQRFGNTEEQVTDQARIIILNKEEIIVGITVDNVTEVIRIKEEDIEDPDFTEAVDSKYIEGVGKYKERLLLLLDIKKTLGIDN
ncbi:MAG: chemotaxis protein CheW [Peptococcaceae bacterium]